MKWISNFKKFQKIKEAFDLPPEPPRIEYTYQKPDTSKIDTISLHDAIKMTKSQTENSLESLRILERDKDYNVIFEDDFTGKVLHEKIILNFSDLKDTFDKYTQFNLESKTHFKIYDSSTFNQFFTIGDVEVKMEKDSVFIAFPQGDYYAIIYIDVNGNPNFCGVKKAKKVNNE